MNNFISKFVSWIKNIFSHEKKVNIPSEINPIITTNPSNISKLELWISAIKDMEGAKLERNNPGNLRFRNQKYAINDNGFCKFDTYGHGYDALKNLLKDACMGESTIYKPSMSLLEFQEIYSPASDGNNPLHYATFVADRIKKVYPEITINTPIKELLT